MSALPTVCCVIVLDKDQRILLIKRGKDPHMNKWALISGVGYAKKGMTCEEGVIDEVTGDIATPPTTVKRLFLVEDTSQEVLVFSAEIDKDCMKPVLPHATGAKWISPDELDNHDDLAFGHTKILKRYLSTQN